MHYSHEMPPFGQNAYFTIDPKGYCRINWWDYGKKAKRYIQYHVYLWQLEYGSLPIGYAVHHIDGNTRNNEIANLQSLSLGQHTILHHTKDGQCKDMCLYHRKWRESHPEKVKAILSKYRIVHRDRINDRKRKLRRLHRFNASNSSTVFTT